MVNWVPPAAKVAPWSSPAKVPETASAPSLLMMVKLLPLTGVKPLASETFKVVFAPIATPPVTLS